ncbi:MAG: hypothetical protein IJV14_11275 [Lachnospiraceae bacterium]|nr:hypothetical protein [Lachnospiraceae bacterium]
MVNLSEELPVFAVHHGNQRYMRYAILQAAGSNKVYLIGDESNLKLGDVPNVTWNASSGLLSEDLVQFRNRYVHMSSNSYTYELTCFERHFYIYTLARQLQINQFAMIDSDLLLYGKISDLLSAAGIGSGSEETFDAALCWDERQGEMDWACSPHFSVWTTDALKDFLDYTLTLYSDQVLLTQKWNWHISGRIPGGICDMTALYLWMQNADRKILNLTPYDVPYGFDYSLIQRAEICPYQKDKGIEKIEFRDGFPYFTSKGQGTLIRALTIHAQADSKKYMGMLYRGRNQAVEKAFLDFLDYFYKAKLLLQKWRQQRKS